MTKTTMDRVEESQNRLYKKIDEILDQADFYFRYLLKSNAVQKDSRTDRNTPCRQNITREFLRNCILKGVNLGFEEALKISKDERD